MKRKPICFVLFALLLPLMLLPAHADTGPKPSVVVDILGLEGRACYATLLSTTSSTGPHSSLWEENQDGERVRNWGITPGYTGPGCSEEERAISAAFTAYEETEPDGLYYLQYFGDCSQGEFRWTYYPPQTFKILLYFPDTGSFAASDSLLERYAFDSYYTVDLTGVDWNGGTAEFSAVESYDHSGELLSLAARVVLTIAIELAVAWWFRLREKKQIIIILLTNIVTQLALNLGLNWYVYQQGSGGLPLFYLMMELGVTVVESLVYWALLPCPEWDRIRLTWDYALAANLASLVLGGVLAMVIPSIF